MSCDKWGGVKARMKKMITNTLFRVLQGLFLFCLCKLIKKLIKVEYSVVVQLSIGHYFVYYIISTKDKLNKQFSIGNIGGAPRKITMDNIFFVESTLQFTYAVFIGEMALAKKSALHFLFTAQCIFVIDTNHICLSSVEHTLNETLMERRITFLSL